MAVSRSSLEQLKSRTSADFIRALKRDNWEELTNRGATRPFTKTNASGKRLRVVIHYHPKNTYGPKLLKSLMEDTGWTDGDLRRLKPIR